MRCRYQLAAAYYRLGRLPEAVKAAQQTYREGSEFAGRFACAAGLDIWAMAAGREIPRRVLDRELERPCQDLTTRVQLSLADGLQLLHDGQSVKAVDALEAACSAARAAAVTKPQLGTCQAWLATALRTLAEEEHELDSPERSLLLRQAGQVARRALWRARYYRQDQPHALREAAVVAALRGRISAAKRWFEQSIEIANEQHACFEYARTLEERGRIGMLLGWQDAADDIDDARYLIQQLRSAATTPVITADNRVVRPVTVLGDTTGKFCDPSKTRSDASRAGSQGAAPPTTSGRKFAEKARTR